MSGVPIIGKIFDELQRGIKKVSNEINKSDTLKTIIVIAAVYFTVGAATGAFSAAGATGTATAGATTQAGMLSAQTAAFGSEGAALTAEALASNTAASGAVAAQVAQSAGQTSTASSAATETASTSSSRAAANEAAKNAAADEAKKNAVKEGGIGSWIENNPMQATVLGQAVSGAVQSGDANDRAKEMEKNRRDAEDRARQERANRGLLGYNQDGQYAGIIGSNVNQPTDSGTMGQPPQTGVITGSPATAQPIVASQQIAAPESPTVAIRRADLPKLNIQR